MFGPYEIEFAGQRYFSNVVLREVHIFEYEDASYLFDVGKMHASRISARQAKAIRWVNTASGGLVPESAMAEICQFNLIAQEGGSPKVQTDFRLVTAQDGSDFSVVRIALFVTHACNMRCVYCYIDGEQYNKRGLMSRETAFRAVDWLMVNSGKAESVTIGFFGGEPLLNFPLIKAVVPYATNMAAKKGKQIKFSITTNGSLLNSEILRFLRDEKFEVLISFDGPAEYHNRQRPFKNGKGSYSRVFANVQMLSAVIPNLTGRATFCGDIDPVRIKESMQQAGFTTCNIVNVSPVPSKRWSSKPPDGKIKALRQMQAFNRSEASELLVAIRARRIHGDHLPGLVKVIAELCAGQKRHYGCGIGKGMVGISVTGDIYPCHRFVGHEELCLGNVSNCVISGSNCYWRAVVDVLPECRSCWARYLCGGGCFYHNMAHTGDMHKPEYLYCLQTRAMFEGMIHVLCEMNDADRKFLSDVLNSGSENNSHATG